jgi:periplasmic protein TonB
MAFADETPISQRSGSLAVVVGIHILFALGFWYGLGGVEGVKKLLGPVEIIDVKEPPPPEEPPPPPPKTEEIPPYVPPPEVNVDLPPPPSSAPPVIVQQQVQTPEPPRVVQTPPPPPPPPPREIVKVQLDRAKFAKDIQKYLQSRDVPSSVRRLMEADGVNRTSSKCRVYVTEEGKVGKAECVPEKYQKVAEETQTALMRIKFPPATEDGKPIGSWVDLPTIAYVLPE